MWIRRHEYEALREHGMKTEIKLEVTEKYLQSADRRLDIYAEHEKQLLARIAKLEAALLKANDDAQSARKEVLNRPPQPVNLAALFDDEDEELVEQDRRRAEAEGTTDGLLASMD